jgi:hypothetical protein
VKTKLKTSAEIRRELAARTDEQVVADLNAEIARLNADPQVQRVQAIGRTRPDLIRQMGAGKLTIKQAEREMRAPLRPVIFFIEEATTGLITIGLSSAPAEHLTRLQLGCPTELVLLATLLGTPADLRRLRRKIGDGRVRGEWYRATPYLLKLIEVARG